MKRILFCLAAASATFVMAGDTEVDLLVSKQITRDYTWSETQNKTEVSHPTGVSLRLGKDLIGLGPAQLQVQLTYHAQSSGDQTGTSSDTGLSTKLSTYKNTGFSVGAQAQWRFLVDLGVGAELRYEKLKTDLDSTSQTRPWLNARVGFSVPSIIVHPVFGLEVAAPLTKQGDVHSTSDLLKRLSPNYEVSLYGGIRF